MYVIGLTGGIASGKSTAVKWWLKQNVVVIDADLIAREVVKPGQEALEQIVATFGVKYLQDDGTLNRKLLGQLIFNNQVAREKLDNIMQPKIRVEIQEQLRKYANEVLIILDMPLLIEKNYTDLVDEIWLVALEKKEQLKRLQKRDQLTKKAALARIDSQIPLAQKEDCADVILDNNLSVKYLEEQLTKEYQNLKERRLNNALS